MGLAIGIPKEREPFEYRIGMTPAAVSVMTARGHQCYVEAGAGVGSGFSDEVFQEAGAQLTYSPDEVFRRADLLLKIQRPTEQELAWMRQGQILMSFMFLAAAHERYIQTLQEKQTTVIAYELIQEEDGRLPVMYPLSQIGGRMAAQTAAHYMLNIKGGKGILLGGIAGVPPADVVIVGAGVVGTSAADSFLRNGARVILLDKNLRVLQEAHERFGGQVTTMVSHDFNLVRVCQFADVLVGAVQVPGQRAPIILTREMVRSMRPGSLIIDVSIDQGGCVETSRPTRHDDPVFVAEDVLHYCVPNMPGVVGRSATHAFVNAACPFVMQVADEGLEAALAHNAALRRGMAINGGQLLQDVGR